MGMCVQLRCVACFICFDRAHGSVWVRVCLMCKCQSVKRSKSEQLVSLNASHIYPYTPWIPYERLSWTCVYFVICSLSNKQIHTYDECMCSYVYMESVSHIGMFSYVLGAYSRTNVLHNEWKTNRRQKEGGKKERKKDRQIETEKGSKYTQTRMGQSMQANITICTTTNIHACVAQNHTHIHTLAFTLTLTLWLCEPNVRWPLFTSTHFIDKRKCINTGKNTNNNNSQNASDDDDCGQREGKKAPRNRKEEAAGVLRTRTTLPVVVTHSKHPHTWISYARHLLHKIFQF